MSLFWGCVSGVGETNFLNYSGPLLGGFSFSNCSSSNIPKTLLTIDSSGNINPTGNITVNSSKYIDLSNSAGLKVGSSTYLTTSQLSTLSSTISTVPISYSSPDTTINSNVQVNGLYKTSTTALTYTSTAIGYTTSATSSSTVAMSSNIYSYSSSLTLGIGVWMISGVVQLYASSAATITKYVQLSYTSGGMIIGGTQFSSTSSHLASTVYSTPTGCTCITITTANTQIQLAFLVNSSVCSYNYYYLSATKIA
jgi:hypothetical protein